MIDILESKLVKRKVPLKGLTYGEIIPAAGSTVRQEITMQQGIPTEKAREIVKKIKDSKLKVQASIQGDFVRVAGRDRDVLADRDQAAARQRFRHRHAVHQLPHELNVPRRIESHWIAGPAGRLEALLEEPEDRDPAIAVVVCHPHPLHGGTMHNKVVYRMARGLRQRRSGGAAIQFPRRQDRAKALTGISRARSKMRAPRWAGCGSGIRPCLSRWQASPSAREPSPAWVANWRTARWLLAAGYPTHYGATGYFESLPEPKIIVQSTHDQYGPRAEMEALVPAPARSPSRLVWIEAADHFFAGALEELEKQVRQLLEGPE